MLKSRDNAKAASVRSQQILLSLAIAALLLVVGYLVGNTRLIHLEQQTVLLENQRESLHERTSRLEYQVNILQVELDIERAATQSLQNELRQAQDENATIRRELAFYQRVVAPDLTADGITIDSMVVSELLASNSYYFRLILLQMERIEQFAQGSIVLTLRGFEGDQRKEYNVFELAGIDESEARFVMNYFSLTEGNFALPDGFIPETLHVQVRSQQGRQTERSYQWRQLFANETLEAPAETPEAPTERINNTNGANDSGDKG